MNIISDLSKKIKVKKTYSLDKAKKVLETSFSYNEYLNVQTYSDKEKINLYLKYMLESIFALDSLKKEMKKDPNFENKVKNKKILSTHLKAIKDSKEINIDDKTAVTKFGFYYGWLSPAQYKEQNLYLAGKKTIKKLQPFALSKGFVESKDKISQIARLYEWRKLLWMRLYLLLPQDKKTIKNTVSEFIATKNEDIRKKKK